MDEDEARRLQNVQISQLQRNNGYLARVEIGAIIDGLKDDPRRLEPFGFKVYSQGDEDGIIEEIFRRIGVAEGSFVEIGVENGLQCNSLYLLYKGWRGGWVEGNHAHRDFMAAKFYSLLMSGRLRVSFAMITAENINDVIQQACDQPETLDFLSIDIDGNDIYLLEALAIQPKVICIEYNAKFHPPLSIRQVYDPARFWAHTDYWGSSLSAMTEAASAKGYTLVATAITGANAFYVRNDLVLDRFSPDASPANLYHPPRHWLIYDHFQHIGHPADFGPYVELE